MLQCALCHINNFRIARAQIKLYILPKVKRVRGGIRYREARTVYMTVSHCSKLSDFIIRLDILPFEDEK